MLEIKYLDVYAVFSILVIYGLIETLGGLYGKNSKRSKNDWYVELLSNLSSFLHLLNLLYSHYLLCCLQNYYL